MLKQMESAALEILRISSKKEKFMYFLRKNLEIEKIVSIFAFRLRNE